MLSPEQIDLVCIDEIIQHYDIRTDSVLLNEWIPLRDGLMDDISRYAAEEDAYGEKLKSHLMRISEDGAEFLKFLGFSGTVASNFHDAFMVSDCGKMHAMFDPAIWNLPERPTAEQKAFRRQHTTRALDILNEKLEDASPDLRNHPHIRQIVPALAYFHHEHLSGKGPHGEDQSTMGLIIRVACIVDAFDGDTANLWAHQGAPRTAEGALERMMTHDPDHKYFGRFDSELVRQYARFRLGREAALKAGLHARAEIV